MSTPTRDKIISYLANDVSATVTASACGVTPAYISQMLELVEVREEIALLRAGKLEGAIKADATLESLEAKALEMVEKRLPFVRTAVEAVKIASTLNGMKRKAAPTAGEDALSAEQVTITVPRGASLMFKVNDSNQVIEVEGRTMSPLPSRALPQLQARLAQETITDAVVIQPVTAKTFAEKQEHKDVQRAQSILRDMTTYMDGVPVVL